MRTLVLKKQQAIAVGSMDTQSGEEAEGTPVSDTSMELREHARYNQIMMFIYVERDHTGFQLRVGDITNLQLFKCLCF